MSSDSEEDIDPDIQAILLEKLNSYGDEVIGEKSSSKIPFKKSKKAKKSNTTEELNTNIYNVQINNDDLKEKDRKLHKNKKKKASVVSDQASFTGDSNRDDKIYKNNEVKSTKAQEEAVKIITTEKKISRKDKKQSNKKQQQMKEKRTDNLAKVAEESAKKNKAVEHITDYGNDFESDGESDDLDDEQFEEVDRNYASISNKQEDSSETRKPGQKHLDEIKQRMGLTEKDFLDYKKYKENKEKKFDLKKSMLVPSYGSRKRGPPEVVVFDDPAKKSKKEDEEKTIDDPADPDKPHSERERQNPTFDLSTARHEIRKLGISGLDKSSKEEATVSLLLKLGAKRPKNKFINYKELLKQKQHEKTEMEHAKMMSNQGKDSMGSKPAKAGKQNFKQNMKSRRSKQKIGFGDGQIGKYKNGVQFIKKNDIHKIKSKKRKK